MFGLDGGNVGGRVLFEDIGRLKERLA